MVLVLGMVLVLARPGTSEDDDEQFLVSSSRLIFTLNAGRHFHTVIAPEFEYWPRANSAMNNGIPQINSIKKYGMKNTPPPFSYARYGNLQTLPSPTQYPMHESKNSALPPHVSLFSSFCPVSPLS